MKKTLLAAYLCLHFPLLSGCGGPAPRVETHGPAQPSDSDDSKDEDGDENKDKDKNENENEVAPPKPQPGIKVSQTDELHTNERGTTGSFSVSLLSAPSANVTIRLHSDNEQEGKVDRNQLVFTAKNWNEPQTVVVTGVDDHRADGRQRFAIVLENAESSDAAYNSLPSRPVSVVNEDDDTPNVLVAPTAVNTSENGGAATFTVVLSSQPTAQVVLAVSVGNANEGKVNSGQLVFHVQDWNRLQTVTVTGLEDLSIDGDQKYVVALGKTESLDPVYSGIDPVDVSVTNVDSRKTPIMAIAPAGFSDHDQAISIPIRLTEKATAPVTIPLSLKTADGRTIAWNRPYLDSAQVTIPAGQIEATVQFGLLMPPNDHERDWRPDYDCILVLGKATSADPRYNSYDPPDATITIADADRPRISIAQDSWYTSEDGHTLRVKVSLNIDEDERVGAVKYEATSSKPTEGTVTFVGLDSRGASLFDIEGIDDTQKDGEQQYRVTFKITESKQPGFPVGMEDVVILENLDND